MCIIDGCPNYALETKDTCAGHVGGNIAVPDPTAPRPSHAAMQAAASLLFVPNALSRMAVAMGEITKGLNAIAEDMEALVKSITPPDGQLIWTPSEKPKPKAFFLNEAHETHVTKSQARKERAELKKTQGKGKGSRPSRVARKSRTHRSRNR